MAGYYYYYYYIRHTESGVVKVMVAEGFVGPIGP